MNARRAHALPFGAECLGGGRARFRVWAPQRTRAALVAEGRGETALRAEGGGWFSLETDAGPGLRYRYRFDDGEPVPDPASRAQPDGVAGPSLLLDPCAYAWRHEPWQGRPWHEAIVYELHVGACGGYAGVRERLPYLRDLGVTAVELMPLAEFPGRRNWGYDGVLPFAPASCYGRPEELKALVDEAHGLGLMVLLDVVYNHFGPEGNHLSGYAASFFRDDRETPWGRAIDFRRREVDDYFVHNALYWLGEYRFDGLRLDAVHAIGDRRWLEAFASRVRARVEPGRHVHLVLENDDNSAALLRRGFDAQWNDDFHHALHVLLTGEREGYYADYAPAPAAALARCLAQGFCQQGEHSAYRGANRGEPSGDLAPSAFVAFLQNHDQIGNRAFGERVDALAPAEAVAAARALVMLSPQVPMLFMGEEWASRRPFRYFTDYRPPLADAVRDGRRREFARFAAFAAPAAQARIPDPNEPSTFAESIPDFPAAADAPARTAAMRRLIEARRRHVVPHLPGTRALGAEALGRSAVLARWRLAPGRRLALYANLGAEEVEVAPRQGGLVYESQAGDAGRVAAGRLPPFCAVALIEEAPA